ncbi:MAG: sulfite exporter TauE/SafE family protein, partial [Casimicrobiaceae bacterium]
MNFALVPVFLALGAFVGFLAGLLGIGGGFTMVPVLTEIFHSEGFAREHLLPMAIGTSAATIVFTSFSSARAHHARGAVAWPVVLAMAPGLVVGSLIGPQIASALPAPIMAGLFGAFIWFGAYRILRNKPPKADRELPGKPGMFGMGALIGTIAGMVGTGGAFLAVPFLTRCNVKL